MHINQLYEQVTQQIIRELEGGTIPWTKPWKTDRRRPGSIMPHNFATGRAYHGINIPILWGEASARGYPRPLWLTYRQAQALGGQVRKGERSTTVVFMKRLTVKDKDTDADRQVSMLRTYAAFNVSQVDGLKEPPPIPEVPDGERHERAEAFIKATGADIRDGGDNACYVPSHDFISLPARGAFRTMGHFYATALHEEVHWTGAEPRLNRNLTGRFGTQAYAAEELVAELGAAFLCAHLGIEGELRHAGYIEHWLKLLKSDNRAVFTAAAKASQAADYLRAFSEEDEDEEEREAA